MAHHLGVPLDPDVVAAKLILESRTHPLGHRALVITRRFSRIAFTFLAAVRVVVNQRDAEICGIECGRIYQRQECNSDCTLFDTHLQQPLLVIWDGLRANRSRLVRAYLDRLDGHIQIIFLPPYAPDLNPVEYLWAWLKRHAMANYCPTI